MTSVAQADFLASQAQPDGSYVAPGNLATPTQATAEAVQTLRLLGRGAEVNAADAYLVAETWHGTEYLARKIVAGVDSGNLDPSLVTELYTHQNTDGGFGEVPGYDSNPLDTAFALDALVHSNSSGSSAAGLAVNYLLRQQGANGSWSAPDGTPDFYTTALATRALFPFGTQFAATPAAVASASTYLISGQAANGSWSSDLLSAQALLTLATVSNNNAVIKQGASALSAAQLADGSWSEDVYSTALALRALWLVNQGSPANNTAPGSVAGYVLTAQSNEPLSGASVSVSGSAQTVQTNSSGYFVLPGVPAGSFTVVAALPGYSSASAVGTVQPQQTSTVGPIILSQANGAAVLRGSIFDAANLQPLAGARIALSAGSSNWSATTGSDGSFELDNLAPGTYSVTFQASGYTPVSGTLSAPAGLVTAVKQGLTPQGTYQDNSPGTLSGQMVDASSGQPLAGATLSLNGGAATATSASDGSFTFAAVPRGNAQILASAPSYVARTYSFVFAPGDSGNLGSLSLYAATTSAAPTTLTLMGTVIDGVSNQPLSGATITVGQTTVTSSATGQFTVSGLTSLTFNVSVSDTGYLARSFSGIASGFGQVSGTFALTPASSTPATTSTLAGLVLDASTQRPIAGALLSVANTNISATTAANGSYQLANLQPTALNLVVSAPGYTARGYAIDVSQPGNYALNVPLTAAAVGGATFQVQSFSPLQGSTGANSLQQFAARIVNLQSSPQTASLLAYVVNSAGVTVATVAPYAPGTTTPTVEVGFAANQSQDIVFPWNTAQWAPGTYQVQLHVIQPGTITKAVPKGTVLTSADTQAVVTPTAAFQGQIAANPPLAQAGAASPVTLSAVLINSGNVPLSNPAFTLAVTDPTSSQTLTTVTGSAATVGVGQNTTVNFGSWVPTTAGNLPITVHAVDSATAGSVTGTLYVGDKATGTFTVDRTSVPLGTQSVRGTINVQGVDVTTGYSTDPLFAAVKQAVAKGSVFVAPAVQQWKLTQNPQCLGCHIQTQSLVGLSAAQQKKSIDPGAAPVVAFLYNDIAGTQQADGGLYMSHYPYFSLMQTALGAWALSYWPDAKQVFPTLYKASNFLMNQRSTSGNTTWWNYSECSDCDGWWANNEAMNMAVVTGFTGLLNDARNLNGFVPQDFTLQDAGNTGNSNMMDAQPGPDGSLWYVDYNGAVYAYNLATQQTRTVASGIASPAYGLATRPDGTLYVSSASTLTRIAPDGTRTVLLSGGQYGSLTSVALGPDGLLYVVDHDHNCVYQVSDAGVVNPFACGGLLTGPHGAVFNGSNLLVTNNGTGNFRIVSIAPGGAVSVFADGLSFPPDWIRAGADGFFYVATDQYGSYQYTDPPEVYRVSPAGLVQSLPIFNNPGIDGFNTIASIGGAIYVQNPSNQHLYQLKSQALDISQLAAIQAVLPSVAQYTLNQYQDNNPSNALLAMRIILLNEIRPFSTDSALLSQIDGATATLAALLRQRQNADGGWPYTGTAHSDPTATSFVGLALQFTHPSVNDPAIRNSISYLLNSQNPDGSWTSYSQAFHRSNLGPASFVMDYLPQALEQLGGIDTGITVTTAANVQLSAPSIVPTRATVGADGSTTYNWGLTGVTSAGENISFDLTLDNMTFNENRPVATAAYLGFANSFTNETLTANLSIPTVKVVGAVSLTVATDQSSYPANVPVLITSTIGNAGPNFPSGQTHVVVRAADGTLISDLGNAPVGPVASGGAVGVNATFNTGTLLAGTYSVESQLFDQNAQLIGDSTTTFAIVAPTATVIASVTPDKLSYQAWDSVALTGRVRNVSANAIQAPATATLTVLTPSGASLYTTNFPINTLVPGAIISLPATLSLHDAVSGSYAIQLSVSDATTHAAVASANGSFQVNRVDSQAITGRVTVQSPQVYQGTTQLCTDTVTNLSAGALSGITLTRSVVSLDTQAVVSTTSASLGLGAQQQQVFIDSVATATLPVGAYACVLAATTNGSTRQLAASGFNVQVPPIRITAALSTSGARGRLLVLMDGDDDPPCGHIQSVELWVPFHAPLPADARVDVVLRDVNGQQVDSESVALASYRGVVNQTAGQGADLAILGLSREVLTVQLRGGAELQPGYRVVATVHSGSLPPMVLDSGSMGSARGWPTTVGARFGDFTSSNVRASATAWTPRFDAQQRAPSGAQQRAFLEQQLQAAGWSYRIVTEDEDFEHELRTGLYNQYAVFSQRERLDEHAREELREAVFRGEGLLYAGRNFGADEDDDEGPHDLGLALGVRWSGALADMTAVNLSGVMLPVSGTAPLVLDEDVARVQVRGAQVVGRFAGSRGAGNPAVTAYTYGLGTSVYVDYELLAEATRGGAASLHAALLEAALQAVQPQFTQPHTGQVVPLHLSLLNQGVAIGGRIQVTLPAGVTVIDPGTGQVSGGVWTSTYNLAVAQQSGFDLWMELPKVPGPVKFDALIQTGTAGAYVDYTHATLTVTAVQPASLADARALAAANRAFDRVSHWLDTAQFWISHGRNDFALLSLLAATDELAACPSIQATPLRLDIDQVIWELSRSL
jgi:hypothetical protein